ncbi:MAG: thermonuclease family protein, partial [Hyphomicrobium sp.]
DVQGAARAVDGDSLFVGRDEVRLQGIDAPEGKQTCTRAGLSWDCGNAARDELRRLIGKDVVRCQAAERDKHGRVLGQCSAGGRDLNAGMVASGFAVSYGGYLREQGEAKARRRGLWSGEFQTPRDWRHERGIGL